jgi:hypothetical protein
VPTLTTGHFRGGRGPMAFTKLVVGSVFGLNKGRMGGRYVWRA